MVRRSRRRSGTSRRRTRSTSTGLDLTPADVEAVLRVDKDEWEAELPQVTAWFEKFGDKLPAVLWAELDALRARLATA